MQEKKTKSILNIEKKMDEMDINSIRYHVLETARNFKSSWIALGQALFSVWKDKLYKNWGYMTFDAYTSKEIGIKNQTAVKLLRSYRFLEHDEPGYLKLKLSEDTDPSSMPDAESVNILRLAKNKKLDPHDYNSLKDKVLEKGQDRKEVKKQLTQLIREREELDPASAREKKKTITIKRLLGTLKSVHNEAKILKLLPAKTLNQLTGLIEEIESEIS